MMSKCHGSTNLELLVFLLKRWLRFLVFIFIVSGEGDLRQI